MKLGSWEKIRTATFDQRYMVASILCVPHLKAGGRESRWAPWTAKRMIQGGEKVYKVVPPELQLANHYEHL